MEPPARRKKLGSPLEEILTWRSIFLVPGIIIPLDSFGPQVRIAERVAFAHRFAMVTFGLTDDRFCLVFPPDRVGYGSLPFNRYQSLLKVSPSD